MKKILIIIFYLLLSINFAHTQKIDDFIKNIKYLNKPETFVFYDFISTSGMVDDVDTDIGHGIIKLKPSDTLKCFHNISIFNDEMDWSQIYTGKNIVSIDHKKHECLFVNVDTFGYGLITGNAIESLRPKFLYSKDYFKKLISNKNIKKISLEKIHKFGKNCSRLEIKFDESDYSDYYYFDESNYPIGYEYFFEMSGIEYKKSLILYNIRSLEDREDDIFNFEVFTDNGYKLIYPAELIRKYKEKEKQDPLLLASQDSLNFDSIDLEKYKGKIVLMDFWYLSCPPCLKLLPDIIKLHSEFPDIVFLGINTVDKPEKISKFIKKRDLKYKIIRDKKLTKKYKISSYPTVLIFNKSGKVIKRIEGYSENTYSIIKQVLLQNK